MSVWINLKKHLTLQNSWVPSKNKENYSPTVTMPYSNWVNYVSSGKNVMYGDAIIPSGTVQTGFGNSGAVYKGHVRQNPYI